MTVSDKCKLLQKNRRCFYLTLYTEYICVAILCIISIVSRSYTWVYLIVDVLCLYLVSFVINRLKNLRLATITVIEKVYRDRELFIAEDTEYSQSIEIFPEKTERHKKRKKLLNNYLEITRTDFHYQTDDHQSFVDYLEKKYPSADKKKSIYWYYRAKSSFLEEDFHDAEYCAIEYEKVKNTFPHKAQHQADQIFGLPISIILSISGNRTVDREMVERYGRSADRDPERWLWIGLYYARKGDRDSAEQKWRQLIACGRDYNDTKYAWKYLGQDGFDIEYKYRSISELKIKNAVLIGLLFLTCVVTLHGIWTFLQQIGVF